MFHEINPDQVDRQRGMDVTVVTTATTDEEGRSCCGGSDFRSGKAEEPKLAKKALVVKAKRPPKFKVRGYTRCNRCGRPRAVYRRFGLCRIWLPHDGASRRTARHHQVQLVSRGSSARQRA